MPSVDPPTLEAVSRAAASLDGFSDGELRCSQYARDQRARMIGTANRVGGYLLVDWPLPWPREVETIGAFAQVTADLATQGTRLQFVHRVGGGPSAPKALLYRRDAPFVGFECFEASGAGRSAVDQAMQLLAGRGQRVTANARDLLVCGHGARDICCGSSGTRLAVEAGSDRAIRSSNVRLWRTSHLGGHRFAPTAVSLPDGMVWGNLDLRLLRAVVLRGDHAELWGHLRGCSGLSSAPGQVLDERAFQVRGWEWLKWARTDAVCGTEATVTGLAADGRREIWRGVVVEGRRLPVPLCRAPLTAALKSEVELNLAAFRVTRA